MTPEIEALFYAKSIHQAEIIDSYVQLHIKQKPRLMPRVIYNYLLKTLLEMQHFIKLNKKDPREVNLGKDFHDRHVNHDGFSL